MGLIYDNTITVATTQVDITTLIDTSTLNMQKGELYKAVLTLKNASTVGSTIFKAYVNDNVTDTNYYYQQISADGSATPTGARFNQSRIGAAFKKDTSEHGVKCEFYIKVTNSGEVVIIGSEMLDYGLSTIIQIGNVSTSTFTVSSVTKLSIVATKTNAIDVDSRIQLYKVAEKVQDIEITTATTQQDITVDIQKGNEYILDLDLVGASDYYLYANDDTTGYNSQRLSANSSTVDGARTTNALVQKASTKSLGICNVKLPNSGIFNFQNSVIREYGGSGVILDKHNGSDNTVITSITKLSIVSATANQILNGSRIGVYRLL